METFKIKLENYNTDVPALEFGCFSDDQVRLMIALVEGQLRDAGNNIEDMDFHIKDVTEEIKKLEKEILRGRENNGLARLEVFSHPEMRFLIGRRKRLERLRLDYVWNRNKINTLYKKFRELADYLHRLNPYAEECYHSDSRFMGNS
tara:strand:- start:442 stop:882 length:441 start_codon:yes stop_codon:yes gene_type:complete